MNAISNHPFITKLLLPVLVIITLWHLSNQSDTLDQKRGSTINKASDYTLHHFTMTIMNKEGNPARVISGMEMVHYPDDDSTEIFHPIGRFFAQGKDTWTIIADKGNTQGKGEEILLTGHVVITQENHPDIKLQTEKLTIDTIHNTAYTDLPVTIISPNGITHSVGLHAALKDKTINLHSRVKGHYDAPPVN